MGTDGREPGADPCVRPYRVPHVRALTRASTPTTRRRRVPRLRRAAVDYARRGTDRRTRGARRIDPFEFRLPQRPGRRRRTPTGQGLAASVGLAPVSRHWRRPGQRRRSGSCFNAPMTSAATAGASARHAARRRHGLHVVRHRQHRDRESVDDAGPAPRAPTAAASLPPQRRAGNRPGHRDDHAADLRRRSRPTAVGVDQVMATPT